MLKGTKRTNEKRIRAALRSRRHQTFLLQKLREEWSLIEKGAKREALVRRAKTGGIIIGKTILIMLAIAGVLTVAAVAPNVFGAIGKFSGKKRFFNKKDFQDTTKYLKNKKFITMRKNKDYYHMKITDRGANIVFLETLNHLKVKRQKTWDGIWRIVIFDIPDKHKWARDAFRKRLRALDFYQMQKSVFIIPYPCDQEIDFLASLLNLSDYIRVIKTSEINSDSDLQEHFSVNK